MSRNFIYTEGIGWNWHKSWNMPDIICELEVIKKELLKKKRFEIHKIMND